MQPVGSFLGLGGTPAVFLGHTMCLHGQSVLVPSSPAVLVRGGQVPIGRILVGKACNNLGYGLVLGLVFFYRLTDLLTYI